MDATAWFVVVVAAVIVAFVGYGMARRAKGSIEVTLPGSTFEAGDTIRGQVTVQAKKPIEAERLMVTVTATETTKSVENGETRSTSKEVFRGERVLEEARSYPAGARETHDFDIALPEETPAPEPDPTLGKASFANLKAAKGPKAELTWRLQARLEAKGIDLATSRPLTVNIARL